MDCKEQIFLHEVTALVEERPLPKILKEIFTKVDLDNDKIALNMIKYLCDVINDKNKLPWPVKDDKTLRDFSRALHKFMAETRRECPGFTFPGVSLSSSLTIKDKRRSFIFELSTSAFELTFNIPREPQGTLKKCKHSWKNKVIASAVNIIADTQEGSQRLLTLQSEEKQLDDALKKAEEILKGRFAFLTDNPNQIEETHKWITGRVGELEISNAKLKDLKTLHDSLTESDNSLKDAGKLEFDGSDLEALNPSTIFKADLRFLATNEMSRRSIEKITETLSSWSNFSSENNVLGKELKNLVDLKEYKEIHTVVETQLKFLKQKCFKDQEKVMKLMPKDEELEVSFLQEGAWGLDAVTPEETILNFSINEKDLLSYHSPASSNDSEICLSSSNITVRNRSSLILKTSISSSSPLAKDLAKKLHRARFSEPLTELDDTCDLSPVASSSLHGGEEPFDILDETQSNFLALHRNSIFEGDDEVEEEKPSFNSFFDDSLLMAKGDGESFVENSAEIPTIEREPGTPGSPLTKEAIIEKYRRLKNKIQFD